MPKRKQLEHNQGRHVQHLQGDSSPSTIGFLLFWPFYLVRALSSPLPRSFRFLARFFGYPCAAGLYALLILTIFYGWRAKKYDLGKLDAMPERCIVVDRLGQEIGRIGGEKREIVPLDQVSEAFRKAIIAREDERFYQHGAFDVIGIGRAFLKNLQGKREGASTITQQLASDLFQLKQGENRGDRIKQIDRKFLEIAIAIRIESCFDKNSILQAYVNQINWGRQIRGISEASRIYLEKHPSELDLSQAALLAGIVRGPDSFNPFSSMEAATRERNTTLARMVNAQMISEAEANQAKQQPIQVRPVVRRQIRESYAMDTIRRELEIILEKQDLALGGLEVITSLDSVLQAAAEQSIEKNLLAIEKRKSYAHLTRDKWNKLPDAKQGDASYIQGATTVIENRTGAVLAIVGGRDANESRFNRATDGKRQLGSIFKPFVYLSAFHHGLKPDSLISDGPIQRGEIKGGGTWKPHNSDNTFGGMMPASYGLIRSRNTMSVRVGDFAGIPKVKTMASLAGFSTPMPENPSSFLGSWESTTWEAATAYSIFPNEGTRYRPYLISQIKDRDGNVLYSTLPLPYQAASSHAAWSVSGILQQVMSHGTAASVQKLGFSKPCGGKTGTTNNFKDAWFVGYSSSVTCAVWVGFDQPTPIFHGAYGATLALPIWVDIMKTADLNGYKAGRLHNKSNLLALELCRLSNKRATAGCRAEGTVYIEHIPTDTAPPENDFCPIHPARAITVASDEPSNPPAVAQNKNPSKNSPPATANPASTAPRALPVDDDPPLRAIPVEDQPLRAIPVDEDEND